MPPFEVPEFTVNVMFVFPKLLPMLVPVQLAAPAPVISLKSTFVSDTAAAVMVLAVPSVFDTTNSLLVILLPVAVNVPVQVKLPPTINMSVLAAVPVRVTFFHVPPLADSVTVPELVHTSDAPFIFTLVALTVAAAVQVITAVFAVIVSPVAAMFIAVPLRASEIAEEPRVSVRVDEPVELIILPVMAKLPVLNVPAVNIICVVEVVGIVKASPSI